MTDISSADRERRNILAALELATADSPTPPTRAAILARLSEESVDAGVPIGDLAIDTDEEFGREPTDDHSSLVDPPNTDESVDWVTAVSSSDSDLTPRRRPLLVAAAAVIVGVVGGAAFLGARGTEPIDVATTDQDTAVFSCYEPEIIENLDDSGNVISRSGTWLTFPCRAEIDGSGLTVLDQQAHQSYSGATPSPNGRLVAFRTDGPNGPQTTVIEADTGELVLNHTTGRHSWMPDGEQLLVTRIEDGAWVIDLVDLDGSVHSTFSLQTPEFDDLSAGPLGRAEAVPSADGTTIAVAVSVTDTEADTRIDHVLLVDVADGSVEALTSTDWAASELAWSPDGRLDVGGHETITSYDPDGGPAVARFEGAPELLGGHSYSPDGRFVASRHFDLDVGWSVAVADVETLESRLIEAGQGLMFDGNPTWSPDGSKLIIGAQQDGQTAFDLPEDLAPGATPRVAIIDVATGSVELLAIDGGPVTGLSPSWLAAD